jgi:hypothetical protein
VKQASSKYSTTSTATHSERYTVKQRLKIAEEDFARRRVQLQQEKPDAKN